MNDQDAGRGRLLSLDAYRGFVMLALATGGLGITVIAPQFADSQVWQALDRQFDHIRWRGCTFWDLIQPSFMFIVGVAMPFSYARRRELGLSWWGGLGHAVWRSVVLIALGVFLASAWSKQTNFVFVNVLAQIGLGYTFVYLLLGRPPWLQMSVAVAILAGYWLWFALTPLGDIFDRASMAGFPREWERLSGFAAHWEKYLNPAADFDYWFLNLFPREGGKPFVSNDGGYTTLNFVPSIATMLFGVMAGQWLRAHRTPRAKLQTLLIVGALAIAAGTMLDANVCPIVKRIWTPSWVIYSTGWTCWMLAFFYGTIDILGYRRWALPLVVVGVNSIAMYLMSQLLRPFIRNQLRIHLGRNVFDYHFEGVSFEPLFESIAIAAVLWLICLWMYRRKIFLKI